MNNHDRIIQVLLVDDEENTIKSLQRLLLQEEFELHTALSAEEGLAALKELDNVGLIMSDQHMPGMTGAEFLQRCREITPDALRILLTGYSDINVTIDAINKVGAYRYIAKPWNYAELVQTMRDAVRQYTLLLENRRLNEIVLQQNDELNEWNQNLKRRVLEQTTAIRQQNEDLHVLIKKVDGNFSAIISAFSGLVELHSGKLRKHSRNVTNLSVNAAKELGIKGDELKNIRIAALLHDIGKIGISERALFMSRERIMSREEMNADELKEYLQHPIRGQVAVDAIEDLKPAGLLIRHHHENFNGSGFPDGLAGDAIPLGARIIAFANCIDNASETCTGDITDMALARTGFLVGKCLDPSLHKVFRKVAKYAYFSFDNLSQRIVDNESRPTSYPAAVDKKQMVEVELKPHELREGMLLSKDVRTGSGILLVNRSVTLSESILVAIKRNYYLDAPSQGVYVLQHAGSDQTRAVNGH